MWKSNSTYHELMTFFCSLLVAVVSGQAHCRSLIKDCRSPIKDRRSIVQIQEKLFATSSLLMAEKHHIGHFSHSTQKWKASEVHKLMGSSMWLTKGCPTKFWYERNILQHILWIHGSFLKCSILNNTLRHNGEVGQHLIKMKPHISGILVAHIPPSAVPQFYLKISLHCTL